LQWALALIGINNKDTQANNKPRAAKFSFFILFSPPRSVESAILGLDFTMHE
jgi:hypothetical protein